MKMFDFNGLLVGAFVLATYWPIHSLPDRKPRPTVTLPLRYDPVSIAPAASPLAVAGAWEIMADDPRLGGLSGLAIDQRQFLAISDLGGVVRFDPPSSSSPQAQLKDLRAGPGDFGRKWARDAESLGRDPGGTGWWIGYEQRHSLWLYDQQFERVLDVVDLGQPSWGNNRGAEGLVARSGSLLVIGENGRDLLRVRPDAVSRYSLNAGAEIADAASAPNGSTWVLTRTKGLRGIEQSVAPLIEDGGLFRIERRFRLPKGAFDNFEGMAIAALPNGNWRFWLVTDDGHRFMARTLLVAFDYSPHHQSKSPATGAGLSTER